MIVKGKLNLFLFEHEEETNSYRTLGKLLEAMRTSHDVEVDGIDIGHANARTHYNDIKQKLDKHLVPEKDGRTRILLLRGTMFTPFTDDVAALIETAGASFVSYRGNFFIHSHVDKELPYGKEFTLADIFRTKPENK